MYDYFFELQAIVENRYQELKAELEQITHSRRTALEIQLTGSLDPLEMWNVFCCLCSDSCFVKFQWL